MATSTSFKAQYTVEQRIAESTRIRDKCPGKIPAIVERAFGAQVSDIRKKKWMLPPDLEVGALKSFLKEYITPSFEGPLDLHCGGSIQETDKKMPRSFTGNIDLYCGDDIQATREKIETVYKNHKDADGFLYFTYSGGASAPPALTGE